MLDDVYFKPGTRAVWWPILLNQGSYIYIQTDNLRLPDQIEKPSLFDVMRACQVNANELWLGKGQADLAWAEKQRQSKPWTNLGSGADYSSRIEQRFDTNEYKLLTKLLANEFHFGKIGVLRFNFGLMPVAGIIHSPSNAIWI